MLQYYFKLFYFLNLWIYFKQLEILVYFKIDNFINKQYIFIEILQYSYLFRKLLIKKKINFQHFQFFNINKFIYFLINLYPKSNNSLVNNYLNLNFNTLSYICIEPLLSIKLKIYFFNFYRYKGLSSYVIWKYLMSIKFFF